GIRHTEVSTTRDGFLPRLLALVKYHEAPVATISYFAHAGVMERIAEAGYRIAISGTAADELFSGYYDHHLAYLAQMPSAADFEEARDAWQCAIRPLVRNPFLRDPNLLIETPAFRGHLTLGADEYRSYLTD